MYGIGWYRIKSYGIIKETCLKLAIHLHLRLILTWIRKSIAHSIVPIIFNPDLIHIRIRIVANYNNIMRLELAGL